LPYFSAQVRKLPLKYPLGQGCSKVGRCQSKSECRKPKSEGNPKSEVTKDQPRWRLAQSAAEVLLGFRASGFLRISVFGIRISVLPELL
jgi:hypothetical protein